jgi:hypothetical protein
VEKNTPKKSPAGKVRRGRVAAQNQPAGNLQKRCCTNGKTPCERGVAATKHWYFTLLRAILSRI